MQRVTVEELELVKEECKELIKQLQVTKIKTKVLFEKVEIMHGFDGDVCIDEMMQRGNFGLEMLYKSIQSIDGYLNASIDWLKTRDDIEVNKKYFT